MQLDGGEEYHSSPACCCGVVMAAEVRQGPFHVHIDADSAMTGISLFSHVWKHGRLVIFSHSYSLSLFCWFLCLFPCCFPSTFPSLLLCPFLFTSSRLVCHVLCLPTQMRRYSKDEHVAEEQWQQFSHLISSQPFIRGFHPIKSFDGFDHLNVHR